jgi:hypothetical protein
MYTTNKNHKIYQHKNQILNITFTKHSLHSYNCIKLKMQPSVEITLKTQNFQTVWQSCDIQVQFKILQSIWQHYADKQEHIAHGVKLIEAVNGDYFLMWTESNFARQRNV